MYRPWKPTLPISLMGQTSRLVGVVRESKGCLVTYVHIPRSLANIPAKPHSGTHVMQQWACLNAFSDWNSCEGPGAEKFATTVQVTNLASKQP